MLTNTFELWIAAAAVFSGALYFVEPRTQTETALYRSLHDLDYFWNGLYLAGGLMTFYGIVRLSPRSEAAGLSLLAAAFLTSTFATVHLTNFRAVTTVGLILGLAAACFVRIRIIIVAYRIDRHARIVR